MAPECGSFGVMARIAVVGSLNLDVVMLVNAFPAPGETVMAQTHFTNPGGKGANQAVAAARLGNDVVMVGAVGHDATGRQLVEALKSEGIDTVHVHEADSPTGMASIAVDASAQNTIVVGPGANGRLTSDHVDQARKAIAEADVVLVQLEVPIEVVMRVAEIASGTVILNPAPAQSLPQSLLERVDVLVPNETELAALVGIDAIPQLLVSRLKGPGEIIVTLGEHGALIGSTGIVVPALPVEPVDTTAAGDSFCGALADALATGESIENATRWAVAAAAVTVTRHGAQQSLPTRREVEQMLAR